MIKAWGKAEEVNQTKGVILIRHLNLGSYKTWQMKLQYKLLTPLEIKPNSHSRKSVKMGINSNKFLPK